MPISKLSVAVCVTLASVASLFAQTTFNPKYAGPMNIPSASALQADLNMDGVPDFIVPYQELLSTGSATYKSQSLPSYIPVVSGDFNNDGKTDVFFYNDTGGSQLFDIGYGDGKGGFTYKATPNLPGFTTGTRGSVLGQATDVNGDGRADLLLAAVTSSSLYVRLFLNNGSGFTDAGNVASFSIPPGAIWGPFEYLDYTPAFDLLLGDFDADGHADLAVRYIYHTGIGTDSSSLYILYGDGAGHFTPKLVTSALFSSTFTAADINDDTRSDLIGTYADSTIHIFRSNAGRTFTETVLSSAQLGSTLYPSYPPVVADFDGNGWKDIVYPSFSPTPNDTHFGIRGIYQSATHTWQVGAFAAADIFTASRGWAPYNFTGVGDYNRDGKPDPGLILTSYANTHPNAAALMLNAAARPVGSCPAPAIGIHVCSPGTSSTSPVKFSFSATSFYPMRKMEVWVDGVKKSETYHVFADQGFSDVSLPLTTGTHKISFFSGTYDGGVTKKSITITVP